MYFRRALYIAVVAFSLFSCKSNEERREMFVAGESNIVQLFRYDKRGDSLTVKAEAVRGETVDMVVNSVWEYRDNRYVTVYRKRRKFLAEEKNLSGDKGDVVKENTVYMVTTCTAISDTVSSKPEALLKKGSKAKVLGYDRLMEDGTVNRYFLEQKGIKGYVYARYTTTHKDSALVRYMPEKYDTVHAKVKNSFNAGRAIDCEFRPYPKPDRKRMPDPCNAFYLTISPVNLRNIDAYIALADSTEINAFVIDLKDDESPGFKAEAMKKFSPTNYRYAGAGKEKLYKEAVSKLHEKGYYAIGRITCFKDSYFAQDNPAESILDKSTGKPLFHNDSHWPSAYSRKAWQFNVELAKECVRKFGFDEINFDYIRFPDKMISMDSRLDYRNRFGESKIQAVQNFLRYACDELHPLGVYVSADVFGESANPGYTTAYGQYWPAISNIVDAICAMPYPDHFADNYYGIRKPWNHPYEIMKAWGTRAAARQDETPSPAAARTWIQAYRVMRHVDRNGLDNDAGYIEKQIRGLYDAGLDGGYNTWLSSANISVYRRQKDAYSIDYHKN